MRRDESVAV